MPEPVVPNGIPSRNDCPRRLHAWLSEQATGRNKRFPAVTIGHAKLFSWNMLCSGTNGPLRIVTVGFVTDVRHWRVLVTTVVTHEMQGERNNPSLLNLRRHSFAGRRRDGLSEASASCKPRMSASFPVALQHHSGRPPPNCSLQVHGRYDPAQLPRDP